MSLKNSMSLKNKVYLITGGTSGIGYAVGINIVKNGGKVILIGRNKKKIQGINNNSHKKKNLIARACDISNEVEIASLFTFIRKVYKRLDGLVNCAGINPSRTIVENTSLDDWNKTIDTNLTGYFLSCKFAIKEMKKKRKGSIVNISSVAANGMRERIPYSSSKAGVIGLTKSLALDNAASNIRVNCICPAYIPTSLVKGYLKSLSKKEYSTLISRHPLKRLGKVEDIATATKFLLSDEANWITGNILYVDGGYHIN